MNSIVECHSNEKYIAQILYEGEEWIKNCLLTPSIISMLIIYRQSILIKIVGACAIYNLMHYAQFPQWYDVINRNPTQLTKTLN